MPQEIYIIGKNPPTDSPFEFMQKYGWANLVRVYVIFDRRLDAIWQDGAFYRKVDIHADHNGFIGNANQLADFVNSYERFIRHIESYQERE